MGKGAGPQMPVPLYQDPALRWYPMAWGRSPTSCRKGLHTGVSCSQAHGPATRAGCASSLPQGFPTSSRPETPPRPTVPPQPSPAHPPSSAGHALGPPGPPGCPPSAPASTPLEEASLAQGASGMEDKREEAPPAPSHRSPLPGRGSGSRAPASWAGEGRTGNTLPRGKN